MSDALRGALTELTDKTGELIAHLQNTGRLRPCFNLPALEVARAALSAQPVQAAQAPSEADARDAARYRYLRARRKKLHNLREGDIQVYEYESRGEANALRGEELDRDIDAAIGAGSTRGEG